jgi:hypothetical protein
MSDNAFIHQEAFHTLCGDLIARGMSREVYSCRIDPDCVVKCEETSSWFQNVAEWQVWQRVKDTEHSRWFAACRWISPSGAVLIMERTRPASPLEYPDKVPLFLTDLKRSNFGMAHATVGGKRDWFVCHDYGSHLMHENGMTKRLKKADWWDEN